MNADIQLLPFSPALAADFRRLNLAWIETFFQVEATDVEQLSHPERILANGGEIWFAMAADETVGTGALVHCGGGDYELAKMAVTPAFQGRGVGALLLGKLIERFQALGGTRLHLETNSGLESAIRLYRRFGFVEFTPATPSPYVRADVFMEWRGLNREASTER